MLQGDSLLPALQARSIGLAVQSTIVVRIQINRCTCMPPLADLLAAVWLEAQCLC